MYTYDGAHTIIALLSQAHAFIARNLRKMAGSIGVEPAIFVSQFYCRVLPIEGFQVGSLYLKIIV